MTTTEKPDDSGTQGDVTFDINFAGQIGDEEEYSIGRSQGGKLERRKASFDLIDGKIRLPGTPFPERGTIHENRTAHRQS